jgi:carboxymethylenebutenolidase
MLISKSHHDVACKNGSSIRIFVIRPVVPDYPQAKFPGANSLMRQFTAPVVLKSWRD